jgi:cell division septal protein FtsQ
MAKRRRMTGAVPWLIRATKAGGWWALRHPQPLLALAAVSLVLWGLWNHLGCSDAFRITQISLPMNSTLQPPDSLIGANLLAVDIRYVSDTLREQQPWLKDVRVTRQLPSTLRIDAIPRTPAAQVRLDRWYSVDADGFVFPEGSVEPSATLVKLGGIERGAVRAGRESRDERLRLGLRVITTLRRAPALISRRLTEVNVADPQQIRFLLDGDTEIRCGSEAELDAHLQRLRAALREVSRQSLQVRYIDVRFQEPVIGPRAS